MNSFFSELKGKFHAPRKVFNWSEKGFTEFSKKITTYLKAYGLDN